MNKITIESLKNLIYFQNSDLFKIDDKIFSMELPKRLSQITNGGKNIGKKIIFNNCDIILGHLDFDCFDIPGFLEFNNCTLMPKTLIINKESIEYDSSIKIFKNNKIVATNGHISGYNYSLRDIEEDVNMTVESFYIRENIKGNKKPQDIFSRMNVEAFLFNGGENINSKSNPISIEGKYFNISNGKIQFYGRNLTLGNCKIQNLTIAPGCNINIEEPCQIEISCFGSFNLFFKSAEVKKKSSVIVTEGSINKTNFKNYNYIINKFKTYVDCDFSKEREISKFYGCVFVNCCFNENQKILQCKLKNCYIVKGKNINKLKESDTCSSIQECIFL